MRTLLNGHRNNKHGFTLVEIIVIIVIVAILAAVVTTSLTGYIQKSKEARLINACCTCVTAAQSIAVENHAVNNNYFPPTDAAVNNLAGIDESQGSVKGVVIDSVNGTVKSLTYYDLKDGYVTYLSSPSPHYVFSEGEQWQSGMTFSVGDTMITNGYIFRCVREHTTGTTSRTRNPSLRSNKSTWEVIGFTEDTLPYSSTVRYGVGMIVPYTDRDTGITGYYRRTDFNLVGGQVPYTQKDSDYWVYIPPEEYAIYNITP